MPWDVKVRGGQYCVFKKGARTPLKCYVNEADAAAYVRALYASEGNMEVEMKRKVERGGALDEVKGSLDYQMAQIRRAFYQQFRTNDDWFPYIVEIFADHVIVESEELAQDEFYMVTYTQENGGTVFAAREQWEIVELAYVPQRADVNESRPRQRFQEEIGSVVLLDETRSSEGPWKIKAVGITAGVVNANNRRYSAGVLRAAVEELKTHLHESAGQGRLQASLTGEPDHPSDKGNRGPRTLETVVNWTDVAFDGSHVLLEGLLLGTSAGRDIHAQMLGGVLPGISQRAYGESKSVKENDRSIDEVLWVTITGYDLTAPHNQSDPNAGVTFFESRQSQSAGDGEMDLEELRKKYPHLVAQIEDEHDAKKKAELEEALQRKAEEDKRNAKLLAEHDAELRKMLGVASTVDMTEALRAQAEELERLKLEAQARQVREYIEAQTKDLPYPDFLKKQLLEAVKLANPATVDEAKATIVAKRKEYDAIQSALVLERRGYGSGIHMMGPVIESELGIPAYARAAWALQESMMASGMMPTWDHRKPATPNQIFAAKMLARFDEVYKRELAREAKLFEEAEIASDLNLPYSVSRAIIAEAFPELVAASIFDFGVTDTTPFRLYYEAFSGDTGYSVTVTDEVETGGAEDTWYALAYKRITPGSVTVTSNPAGTTYTEGTDYIIDYANGEIYFLAAGSINANDVLVDYTYTAIRKGEMSPIERGEINLSYVTVEAAADRLAQQISHEAVVFSRSQLGWDATQRTLMSLVRQIRRKIDQGILYMALAGSLSLASNSGGTWTAATDAESVLVEYIGLSKVKVMNRYYEPTAIALSATNADRLSNWDGFKRDGFPDAVLNSAGYLGRVKGLPVFQSTEMSDSYVLVCNRELVMHRVYQPMAIKGPFPTYDVSGSTSKLLAADQYYAEEYNATEAPVAGKGSHVVIV